MTTPDVPLLKFDVRRCSRETLELFATAFLCSCGSEFKGSTPEERRLISEARVRTRAERDRELTTLLGCSVHAPQHLREITFNIQPDNGQRILNLLCEQTAPEEP